MHERRFTPLPYQIRCRGRTPESTSRLVPNLKSPHQALRHLAFRKASHAAQTAQAYSIPTVLCRAPSPAALLERLVAPPLLETELPFPKEHRAMERALWELPIIRRFRLEESCIWGSMIRSAASGTIV